MSDPDAEHVANIECADGKCRPVFQMPSGRQFVLGDDGKRVFGVWYIPQDDLADEPVIVDDAEF